MRQLAKMMAAHLLGSILCGLLGCGAGIATGAAMLGLGYDLDTALVCVIVGQSVFWIGIAVLWILTIINTAERWRGRVARSG